MNNETNQENNLDPFGRDNERSSFSGRLGYVLAVAGSAVGLGNIWRFPYLASCVSYTHAYFWIRTYSI